MRFVCKCVTPKTFLGCPQRTPITVASQANFLKALFLIIGFTVMFRDICGKVFLLRTEQNLV